MSRVKACETDAERRSGWSIVLTQAGIAMQKLQAQAGGARRSRDLINHGMGCQSRPLQATHAMSVDHLKCMRRVAEGRYIMCGLHAEVCSCRALCSVVKCGVSSRQRHKVNGLMRDRSSGIVYVLSRALKPTWKDVVQVGAKQRDSVVVNTMHFGNMYEANHHVCQALLPHHLLEVLQPLLAPAGGNVLQLLLLLPLMHPEKGGDAVCGCPVRSALHAAGEDLQRLALRCCAQFGQLGEAL